MSYPHRVHLSAPCAWLSLFVALGIFIQLPAQVKIVPSGTGSPSAIGQGITIESGKSRVTRPFASYWVGDKRFTSSETSPLRVTARLANERFILTILFENPSKDTLRL